MFDFLCGGISGKFLAMDHEQFSHILIKLCTRQRQTVFCIYIVIPIVYCNTRLIAVNGLNDSSKIPITSSEIHACICEPSLCNIIYRRQDVN